MPGPLWILCGASLVNRLGTMALPFLVLYLTNSLHFSAQEAGALVAVYGIAALIVAPVSGWLCDRLGALRIMILSLFFSGIMLLLYPLVHSYNGVLILTFIWSLFAETFRPAAFTCIAEMGTPQTLKASFALNRLAVNLGMSVGPALGGFIVLYSFPLIFTVNGVTTLLAAGILIGLSAKRPELLNGHPAAHSEQARESLWHSTGRSLADWRLTYVLLALLPVATVFFQHEATLPLYIVRDLKLPESTFGLLFTVNTALIIALEIPLNLHTAHWPHRWTLGMGALLFGLGFGAMTLAHTKLAVIATAVLWTFGEMFLFPAMAAYLTEIAPPRRRGSYMGLYSMSFSIAFVIAPVGGVWVMQHLGTNALWGLCLAGGLLSTLLFGRIRAAMPTAEPLPLATPDLASPVEEGAPA